MTVIRRHVIRSRRRRGSVIVLVVAVLALLAVIGTVYVVSSRAERSSAAAGSAAVNLENAKQAVMEIVNGKIGESMYDATGMLGGWSATIPNGFPRMGYQAARRWDIPEIGIQQYSGAYAPGSSDYNQNYRDQAWLVSNVYRNVYWPGVPMVPNTPTDPLLLSDLSLITPFAYNPSTGLYDIPYRDPSSALGLSRINPAVGGAFNVVSDPIPTLFDTVGTPSTTNTGSDSLIQLLPFSDASGIRYRWGARILDTNRMANLNVGTCIDTNNIPASTLPIINTGMYYNSYLLAYVSPLGVFNPGDAVPSSTSLDGNPSLSPNPGRAGSWAQGMATANTWQQRWGAWQYPLLRLENPTLLASTDVNFNVPIRTFSLSDELELRSFGDAGTGYAPEFANLWPNTFKNSFYAPTPGQLEPPGRVNTLRGDYTTYSYSRELRPPQMDTSGNPYFDPSPTNMSVPFQYTVTPQNSAPIPVWPMFPARVGVNHELLNKPGATPIAAVSQLVADATNIATAMEFVNGGGTGNAFSHDEACSFAANYLTYRWSAWAIGGSGAYLMGGGPSAVDYSGICLRGGLTPPVNYGSASPGPNNPDLNSRSASLMYVGYSAQPFINQIAVRYEDKPGSPGTTIPTDYALELYNPYPVPLALDNFKIKSAGMEFQLTGVTIAPDGYAVITMDPSKFAGMVDAAAQTKSDANFNLQAAGPVYLMRSYLGRTGNTLWVAVDQFDNTQIINNPPSKSTDKFLARNNYDGTINTNHWAAAVESSASEKTVTDVDPGSASAKADLNLGVRNKYDGGDPSNLAPPLYDRVPDRGDITLAGQIFINIADFNHIMRISNQVDPSNGLPAGVGTIPTQLRALVEAGGATTFTVDNKVHFDFRTAPYMYGGQAPTAYAAGDPRAVSLLECLSFTDRVTDFSIDLGDNNTSVPVPGSLLTLPNRGLSRLRIPGKINVNTAPPEVLLTIPIFAQSPNFVAAILCYRWRTTNDPSVVSDPRIPPSLQYPTVTKYDFRNINNQFPGYGIHSLGELEVPLSVVDFPNGGNAPAAPPGFQYSGAKINTLSDRDQVWAAAYNYLTVRSDTFAVYGYLEAVRQNPRYIGAFDNKFAWYQNGPTAITDDPTDRIHPLLRVGRRRWVAIVDRSQANFSRFVPNPLVLDPRYAGPRVVAFKDLPQ